jgi:hypothetical protein
MHLIRCAYTSTAARPLTQFELGELTRDARRSNLAFGITSALIYSERTFLQILEGDVDAVDELILRIAQDARHCQMIECGREAIERRCFDLHPLIYAERSPSELQALLSAAGDCVSLPSVQRANEVLRSLLPAPTPRVA